MPTSTKIQLNGKEVAVPTGIFLDNEWVRPFTACVESELRADPHLPFLPLLAQQHDAADSSTFEVLNPANGQPIATVAHAKLADVDAAVASSRKAFQSTWGLNAGPEERARLLNKLADLMERDIQFLAELESLNGGKGVRIARDMDLADSIACLRCVLLHFDPQNRAQNARGAEPVKRAGTTPAGRARSPARRSRRARPSWPTRCSSRSASAAKSFLCVLSLTASIRARARADVVAPRSGTTRAPRPPPPGPASRLARAV